MAQVPLKMRVLFLIPALLVLDPPITGSSLASQVKVVALSLPSNVARRTSGVNAEAFNARMEAMMKRLYVQERFIIITISKKVRSVCLVCISSLSEYHVIYHSRHKISLFGNFF